MVESPSARVRNTGRILFWLVFAVGIGLRVLAGTHSLGFVHPDEHQQYLEAAHGIVYGYKVTYWEYERGVRHYLYPGLLACLIYVLDFLGLRDPVSQAMAIRSLLGVSVFVTVALIAHDWLQHRNIPAALGLIIMAALSPDMIFISVRTLSETAMIIPLMLGCFFLRRAPLVSGMLFGTMFAARFQSGFLIVAFFLVAFFDDLTSGKNWLRGATTKMAAGLAASMLCMGWIDELTWGGWFHSPIEHFRANILEGTAATFGVEPWYRYVNWSGYAFLEASPLLLLLLLLGIPREPRVAFAAGVFLVAHCLVAHKEPRFLWPMLPFAMMLIASGFQTVYRWLGTRNFKRLGLAVLGFSLLLGTWMRFEAIDWNPEPMRASSLALAKIGRRPDVTGVAVYGIPEPNSGNYFYLRKNVPYLAQDEPHEDLIRRHPRWQDGTINYLIVRPENLFLFGASKPEKVDEVLGWGIYRLRKPTAQGIPRGSKATGADQQITGSADLPASQRHSR